MVFGINSISDLRVRDLVELMDEEKCG